MIGTLIEVSKQIALNFNLPITIANQYLSLKLSDNLFRYEVSPTVFESVYHTVANDLDYDLLRDIQFDRSKFIRVASSEAANIHSLMGLYVMISSTVPRGYEKFCHLYFQRMEYLEGEIVSSLFMELDYLNFYKNKVEMLKLVARTFRIYLNNLS